MAKNRKSQSFTERFGPAINAFVLCLLIGGAGVGYVWQKNQVHQLGREIKEREMRLDNLKAENRSRADQFATLISEPALAAKVKRLNLGLSHPPLSQIVRLVETANQSGTPDPFTMREQLLAQAKR